MGVDNVPLMAFNRGLISKKAMARTDIQRTAFSAEVQTNCIPSVLGSMTLRPGLQYIRSTRNNAFAVGLPFVKAKTDTAIIELSNTKMRVLVDESPVTRVSVATAITSGDFSSDTGWTDNDEVGAVSTITGGVLKLVGNGFSRAIRTQAVSVAGGDTAKEHGLRVIINEGPVTLRIGTTSGSSDIFNEAVLGRGTHSLAFIPNVGTFYIEFSAIREYAAIVDSCTIEAAGVMELDTVYPESALRSVRWEQSADVVYLGCIGYRQYKIERRSITSWSLVQYLPEDGPFGNINVTNTTLTPSGIEGNITLTASTKIFKSTVVGALFKIESTGQRRTENFTAGGQETDYIRVTGTSTTERRFQITRTGTFVGTITLQRSAAEPGSWVDVTTYTTAGTVNYDDGLSNQIMYYRLVIKSGDYTSGSVAVELLYAAGSITGIARVDGYVSETQVTAIVLKSLGEDNPTINWYEGLWSEKKGFGSAPSLIDGRLFWAGYNKVIGSVSDAYESFDNDIEGDSAPIIRSIGRGAVDNVMWLLPLIRLIIGTPTGEWVARSSSLDEPLTPGNFNLKQPSDKGCADVNAVKVDSKGFFVPVGGSGLYQLVYNGDGTLDYESVNMTELVPEVAKPSIVRLAVQRKPDTRIHCLRSDGKVALLISQPAEEVLCWALAETISASGFIEDVIVFPGDVEDKVLYLVRRTINGNTVRYYERWAKEDDCLGGDIVKLADSFITYDGTSTNTITGLSHLEGQQVVVWANAEDLSPDDPDTGEQITYTVTSGAITLGKNVTKACVGLPYMAQYISTKLAYAANRSTALGQQKRVDHVALILADVHCKGIKFGSDPEHMEEMPNIVKDIPVEPNEVFSTLDTRMMSFNGNWDTDSRICLEMQAPRPATVLAAVVGMRTNDTGLDNG